MPDPVAVKNARRELPAHRVADISFRRGRVSCACGARLALRRRITDRYLRAEAVAELFAEHRRSA